MCNPTKSYTHTTIISLKSLLVENTKQYITSNNSGGNNCMFNDTVHIVTIFVNNHIYQIIMARAYSTEHFRWGEIIARGPMLAAATMLRCWGV